MAKTIVICIIVVIALLKGWLVSMSKAESPTLGDVLRATFGPSSLFLGLLIWGVVAL